MIEKRSKKTKVAFVVDHRLVFEPLGIMQLSSILKKEGFRVKIFQKNRGLISEIRWYQPDVVCYSVIAGSENSYFALNKRVKASFPGVISIMGGPFPTYNVEFLESNPDIDALCRGEGDYALAELLNKIEDEKDFSHTDNFYVRQNGTLIKNDVRPLVEDLDGLPFVDREAVYSENSFLQESPIKRFMVSRVCPFNCSFCFNHAYKKLYQGKGTFCRQRSAENVLAEIETVRSRYPLGGVKFIDDVLPLEFLKTFLPLYKKRVKLPFNCNLRPNLIVGNPEIVELLKEAGCFYVSLGIEAAEDRIRNDMLKRNIELKDIKDACRLLKRGGLKILTTNIIGNPTETYEMTLKTLKLNMELGIDFANCSLLQPYKGTEVYEFAIEKGFIKEGDQTQLTFYGVSPFRFRSKREKRAIENLQKFFNFATRNRFFYGFITKAIVRLPQNRIFFIFSRLYDYYVLGQMYPMRFRWRAILRFFRNYFTFQKA